MIVTKFLLYEKRNFMIGPLLGSKEYKYIMVVIVSHQVGN